MLPTFDDGEEFDDLGGERLRNNNPCNIIELYIRLEVLLRLKQSGHKDALTKADNQIDKIYKKGEIKNKQQYQNDLDKFSTSEMGLSKKIAQQIALSTRPKQKCICQLSWINLLLKIIYLNHYKQTSNKQFKVVVTFLTVYNRIFTNRYKQKY